MACFLSVGEAIHLQAMRQRTTTETIHERKIHLQAMLLRMAHHIGLPWEVLVLWITIFPQGMWICNDLTYYVAHTVYTVSTIHMLWKFNILTIAEPS